MLQKILAESAPSTSMGAPAVIPPPLHPLECANFSGLKSDEEPDEEEEDLDPLAYQHPPPAKIMLTGKPLNPEGLVDMLEIPNTIDDLERLPITEPVDGVMSQFLFHCDVSPKPKPVSELLGKSSRRYLCPIPNCAIPEKKPPINYDVAMKHARRHATISLWCLWLGQDSFGWRIFFQNRDSFFCSCRDLSPSATHYQSQLLGGFLDMIL